MLEHQKIVLEGVRDDPFLFRKELIKSMAWLSEHEKPLFKKWVRETFYHQYPAIVKDVLSPNFKHSFNREKQDM